MNKKRDIKGEIKMKKTALTLLMGILLTGTCSSYASPGDATWITPMPVDCDDFSTKGKISKLTFSDVSSCESWVRASEVKLQEKGAKIFASKCEELMQWKGFDLPLFGGVVYFY